MELGPRWQNLNGKVACLLMSPAVLAVRNWGFSTREKRSHGKVGWMEGNNGGISSKNFPTKGVCVKGLRFADSARAIGGVPGSRPCRLMSYLELQFGIGSWTDSCMKDFVMGMGMWKFAKYRLVYLSQFVTQG